MIIATGERRGDVLQWLLLGIPSEAQSDDGTKQHGAGANQVTREDVSCRGLDEVTEEPRSKGTDPLTQHKENRNGHGTDLKRIGWRHKLVTFSSESVVIMGEGCDCGY